MRPIVIILIIALAACSKKPAPEVIADTSPDGKAKSVSALPPPKPSPGVLVRPRKVDLKQETVSLWTDSLIDSGWRIQKHYYSAKCRILDPENRLRAHGLPRDCKAAFTWLKYKKKIRKRSPRLALLIHGVWSGAVIWQAMEKALRSDGYDVTTFTYPSSEQGLVGNSQALHNVLMNLPADTYREVVIVAHSLGGLVTRSALGRNDAADLPVPVRSVVMLGTPNQGARFASRLGLLARAIVSSSANDLKPERVKQLPRVVKSIAVGVIAGGRGADTYGYNVLMGEDNDGVVTVAETKARFMADFLRLPVLHVRMTDDKQVIAATRRFLRTGRFRP